MPTIFFKCGIFNPKIQPRKGFQILCTWNQREESDGKCFFFQWMYLTLSSTEPGGARREKGCSQTYDVEFKVEELFTS